jgi:DNA polymerase II large subunit
MVECTKEMQKYFDELEDGCMREYKIASEARKKGYDSSEKPEIILAKNMAERVIGIIAVVAPQLQNTDATKRITELEKEYGVLDWRVAFKIAEEVAQEKFCKFKDQKEAIEVGVRTGFAYVTVGVVSSPIEGFTHIDIVDRMDGQGKYFCINFSGPIRNAGGTAAAVCVLIADYLRKKFGYAKYDATDLEIKRTFAEVEDYHTRFSPRQYFPSQEEINFLMSNVPVQIGAESSEKYEVSNYKDLPRVPTNLIRSGFCLLYTDCIPLKAAKLWKQVRVWQKDFDMEDWTFLEEYLNIQKSSKAKKKKPTEGSKISPDYTYIKDLVAGRPVLGYPLRSGAFRLRYGRSRVSGYSGQAVHPATMHVLNNYIATGTQLKVERPGKAAAMAACDTIDGPIVKLYNGNVLFLETEAIAKQHKKEIKEILYLGDILVAYGDFFNRNHLLVPSGYCQEHWALEFEEAAIKMFPQEAANTAPAYKQINLDKLSEHVRIPKEKLEVIFRKPLRTKLSAGAAIELSKKMNIPLHPYYTFYWRSLNLFEFKGMVSWFSKAKIVKEIKEDSKIETIQKIILPKSDAKRSLELIGLPHMYVNNEFVVIEGDYAEALLASLNMHEVLIEEDVVAIQKIISEIAPDDQTEDVVLKIINKVCSFTIKDKSGIFIGSRMGRPEKAKMRKLIGQPHALFPVGNEGGKMRSFQSAMNAGKVTSNFPIFYCEKCKKTTVFSVCETCDKKTTKKEYCKICKNMCEDPTHEKFSNGELVIDINTIFKQLLKKLDTKIYPDLIKGIRGTVNKDHVPEHLAKGILRAKHSIAVNKEGTIRYDASELTLTHFKPKEIGVSVEKLKKLGYIKDTKGRVLESEEQTLELKPQDVVLPCSPESPEEPCDEILFRTTKFIDELLEKLYGLKPFYKLQSKEELAGHLIIGLAPHTSAGTLGRIVGFSKTQGFLAHPMFHAAMRRDTDGDESCIFLLMDGLLNFSKQYLSERRGATMDAPLVLTYILNPAEVDDMVFDLDVGWRYPLELYTAASEYKPPHSIKIKQLGRYIGTPQQYEGMGFTHDTDDFNAGVRCSEYKLLPSMEEKLMGQMDLAIKIRAVDSGDVAKLVIEKHFIRDIKGNLRKFSTQQFRCSNCNEKYRRPPLIGRCVKCKGKIIFTISEGSIIKYLEPTISLGEKFHIPSYLKQTIELTKRRIEEYFGKEEETQSGLGKWFDEPVVKK